MVDSIRAERIKVVGRIADTRYAQLSRSFSRPLARAHAFLKSIASRCIGLTSDRKCTGDALQSFVANEEALGAVLYSSSGTSLAVGRVPFSDLEIRDFREGQQAKFSGHIPGIGRAMLVHTAVPENGLLLGVVYSADLMIQPIFVPHPDLGLSGETFLADGDGFFITRAKYEATQGHSDPISANPMRRCLAGEDAETLDLDYRDVPIIHGFRFIPEMGKGCIMAHIDQAEAFAPLEKVKQQAALATLPLVISALAAAIWLSRRIVRPITRLTEVAKDITAGDLTARAVPQGRDELATLAISFNAMTDQLAAMHSDLERRVEERTQTLKTSEETIRKLNATLEKRVEERTQELMAANRELESISFATSHDLRGPLGRLNSFSTLLEQRYRDRLEGEGLVLLGFIRDNASRLTRLVDDLMSHARIAQLPLELHPVELKTVVESILLEMDTEIRRLDAKLLVDVCPIQVLADRPAICQVLRNLIENALKFTASDSSPIIRIGATVGKDHCTLSVRDCGIGFDMAYRDKIFEMFRRLHTYDEYKGSGVGLALVKRAMERMGGRVWAESQPGQGATFFLELQLASSQESTPVSLTSF